jgi:hypothetical protein
MVSVQEWGEIIWWDIVFVREWGENIYWGAVYVQETGENIYYRTGSVSAESFLTEPISTLCQTGCLKTVTAF